MTKRALDEGDLFVVAASDGFWDKVNNTEAVNMVHDTGEACSPCPSYVSWRTLQHKAAGYLRSCHQNAQIAAFQTYSGGP